MIELELMGAINRPGPVQVEQNITFKELLENYGGGMLRKYPRPIVMQVGGPLGNFVCGSRLNERVHDHAGVLVSAYIVSFFGERFCPVDFIRFLTRFLVREVRIDTAHVRAMNRTIEDIANGRTDMGGLERLRELAAVEKGLTLAEHRMNAIVNDLGIYFGREIEVPETHLNPRIWDIPRAQPAKLAVAERCSNLAEVESTLTHDQALCEADRCMRCDRNSVQELFLRSFP